MAERGHWFASLTRSTNQLRQAVGTVPPTGLVLLSISSTQLGAAIAKSLFVELGPAGTVFLRVGFAALILLLWCRPPFSSYGRSSYGVAILYGLVLAGMNLAFYAAIARIPLGIAVTLEFTGPLAVAITGSRQRLDLLWVGLAAIGIILLTPVVGTKLNLLGIALALFAGSLWAAYILLSARVGRTFSGGTGLALALLVGAIALFPLGVLDAGAALLNPQLLLAGLGVALLSSVITYSLEIEALRHLSTGVFGVLMSLEPAIAAIFGFLILSEALRLHDVLAILLVTTATVGVTRFSGGGAK